MNKEEIFENICKFEEEFGESFYDYFSHDNIKDNSWAFWLLGKGFTEKANEIINLILEGDTCISQDILYHVYMEYNERNGEYSIKNADKNIMLQAEFLSSTPYYTKKVIDFFNEKFNEENE